MVWGDASCRPQCILIELNKNIEIGLMMFKGRLETTSNRSTQVTI